jgi:STE24 endopeptidase
MRLATYRKIAPGPIEELLFFDHPSGYERVHRSMVWLKENQAARYAQQAEQAKR